LGKASESSSQEGRHFELFHKLSIVIGALFYVGALLLYFLGPHSWRHPVTFSLLLGPPGTMLRYALSKLNTGTRLEGKFPIGTFLANMLATAVLAAVYVGLVRVGRRVLWMSEYGQHLCLRMDQYQTDEVEMVLCRRERCAGASHHHGDSRRCELVFGGTWTAVYRYLGEFFKNATGAGETRSRRCIPRYSAKGIFPGWRSTLNVLYREALPG
jgi:hypothetical protein